MKCPQCGEEAVREGDFPEMQGVEPALRLWFCFNCQLMKRPFGKKGKWVKASKEAIVVMAETDILEEMNRFYSDRWTWDTGDTNSREWMDIISEELETRKTSSQAEILSRLTDSRIDMTEDELKIYIDGEWK